MFAALIATRSNAAPSCPAPSFALVCYPVAVPGACEHLSTCRHLPVSETSLLVPVSNGSCPPSEIQLRPSLGVASLLLSASPHLQPHTAKSPQTHPLPCLTVVFFCHAARSC